MSESMYNFTASDLGIEYACACGLVTQIKGGKTLRIAAYEATCPKCGVQLTRFRGALAACQKFCEEIKLVREGGKDRKAAKLTLQIVLPEESLPGVRKATSCDMAGRMAAGHS
jgi:hypothetical protein